MKKAHRFDPSSDSHLNNKELRDEKQRITLPGLLLLCCLVFNLCFFAAPRNPQLGLEIPPRGSALFLELPRPPSLFLIAFDFRRLDGSEQAIEFGLGRVADRANGHYRFAGGEHDLGRSVDREA